MTAGVRYRLACEHGGFLGQPRLMGETLLEGMYSRFQPLERGVGSWFNQAGMDMR